MSTEFVTISIAVFEFIVFILFNRLRSEFLIGAIAVNLILVTTFGGQLITLFGFTTNIGNVFYVAISLALYLLLEHYDYKTAYRAIWVAFALGALFAVLSQLALVIHGISETRPLEEALHAIFTTSPRITLASLLAFLLSQHINLYLYDQLRQFTRERLMWLRSNVSNIVTQIIDSIIFFLIAFVVTFPSGVFEIMLTGFVVKAVFGLLITGFLYLQFFIERQHSTSP